MSKTKKTGRHISGDPRKTSRPMYYKGSDTNRFVEDTNYILPRIYNTELLMLRNIGKASQFGSMKDFINHCYEDKYFLSFQIRLFLITVLVLKRFRIEDILLGDDGYVSQFCLCSKDKKDLSIYSKTVSLVMKMRITQIYDVLMNRTEMKIGVCDITNIGPLPVKIESDLGVDKSNSYLEKEKQYIKEHFPNT